MKLKEGLIQHQVMDDSMWIPTGSLSETFKGMLRGNETAKFLLEHLLHDTTREKLVDALLEEYDVEEKQAEKDVDRFLEMLEREGLLE